MLLRASSLNNVGELNRLNWCCCWCCCGLSLLLKCSFSGFTGKCSKFQLLHWKYFYQPKSNCKDPCSNSCKSYETVSHPTHLQYFNILIFIHFIISKFPLFSISINSLNPYFQMCNCLTSTYIANHSVYITYVIWLYTNSLSYSDVGDYRVHCKQKLREHLFGMK